MWISVQAATYSACAWLLRAAPRLLNTNHVHLPECLSKPPKISEFWNIWPPRCETRIVNLYDQPGFPIRNWESLRARDLPGATRWTRVEATLRLQVLPVSKPLTTLGVEGLPQHTTSARKERCASSPYPAIWGRWGHQGQNRGRWEEGLGLTLPRTVRHGFGSSSGCSSFTTPTQPYSYRSSSSLLLHRPSGCIWETSGEKASVGRPQICGAPAVPVSEGTVKSNLETAQHMGVGKAFFNPRGILFQHNEPNPWGEHSRTTTNRLSHCSVRSGHPRRTPPDGKQEKANSLTPT